MVYCLLSCKLVGVAVLCFFSWYNSFIRNFTKPPEHLENLNKVLPVSSQPLRLQTQVMTAPKRINIYSKFLHHMVAKPF